MATNPEYHKQYIRKHYQENKKYYQDKAKQKSKDVRAWLREYKESNPCTDCELHYHYSQMDFDHLRDKTKSVSALCTSGLKKVKEEIVKCELVCANCHRLRTWKRRQD